MVSLFPALRRFGHQHWIPHGRDRVLRLFADPGREKDFPFEVDFFGLRYLGNLNNFIDWSVYFYGSFAHEELFLMRDIAAHQRAAGGPVTFYDIGANIGHHSLYMSRLADRVISFEPFAKVREKFRVKLEANGCDNVTVFPFALGDANGTVPFYPPSGANAGTGSLVPQAGVEPMMVEIRRGDEVVRDEALPPPTLMKIDVEGVEADVFAGLRDTVLAARPFMLVELVDDTRARVGDEAGLRRLFYPDADLFRVEAHPGRHDYRLRPFDFSGTLEMLIAPRGAAQSVPALAARMAR